MAEPTSDRLASSTLNPKIHSDSGYGSNKSNSQSQRSSGSSKSQQSTLSSGSGSGYPPHPNAPVTNADVQAHPLPSPAGSVGGKRGSGKKGNNNKAKGLDRKPSLGEPKTGIAESGCGRLSCEENQQAPHNSLPPTPQPQIMSPSSAHDSKALQVAALTHALSCMKKFQDPNAEELVEGSGNGRGRRSKIQWEEYVPEEFRDEGSEDAFATVVSLEDGVVTYLSPSITNILGFPKDMLLGRSFIDFVHPRDRMAFASHITCGINFPIGEQPLPNHQGGSGSVKTEPFYCRLRQYRGLKTVGFGVADKTVIYHPFKLTMTLKKVEVSGKKGLSKEEDVSEKNGEDQGGSCPGQNQVYLYLVIGATKLKSAYQYSEEIPKNPGKFVTRHSASCHFGHMDEDAISYLGHLPQDLIGNSVLDYYHPEDMDLLKDIYEAVMQEQGKPFRSKPYRFRVFNGTFAMLETDWSCFINPWSWKLEFVIGQHRVIQGPLNPNVFMQPQEEEDEFLQIPDEIVSDGKDIQNEIRRMLTETVSRRISDPLRQRSSRRRKDLAALMETLLDQMAKTENSDKSGSQSSGISFMERDSAMLGEISPHTVGSNLSSSTPPSYNQLNYRENIERFFQSQPKTEHSDESRDKMMIDAQNQSSGESDSKSSPNIDYSSGSNIRNSSGSNESGNDRDRMVETEASSGVPLGPGSLTQELLTRHNEDMEKYMIQRHRETRVKSSVPGSHKEGRYNKASEGLPYGYPLLSPRSMDDSSDPLKPSKGQIRKKNAQKCEANHGLKRTGNFSWDGDSQNAAKQPHLDRQSASATSTSDAGMAGNAINLWPPFSISLTPGVTTPSYSSATGSGVGGSGSISVSSSSCMAPAITPSNSVHEGVKSQPGSYVFLPGQRQLQQVQLMPAGVVYQPISPYGQIPPILMPLGAMMHPSRSIFLGGSSTPSSQPLISTTAETINNSKKGLPNLQYVRSKSAPPEGREKLPVSYQSFQQRQSKKAQGPGSGSSPSMDGTGSGSEEGMVISNPSSQEEKAVALKPVGGSFSDVSMKSEKKSEQKGGDQEQAWKLTPEQSLRYTLPNVELNDVLEKDLKALKIIGKLQQSPVVNDQLSTLYNDLASEGLNDSNLYVDEGISSNSSGEEQKKEGETPKKMKKRMSINQYARVAIVHEENAPFPPDREVEKAPESVATGGPRKED